MGIFLIVVGAFLLLLLLGGAILLWRLRAYVKRSHETMEETVGGIMEEIDSYEEKTQ